MFGRSTPYRSDNLPNDWGSYYSTCPDCGGTYHQSGTVECDCVECPQCESLVAPDCLVEIGRQESVCEDCVDRLTCPECEKILLYDDWLTDGVCNECIDADE